MQIIYKRKCLVVVKLNKLAVVVYREQNVVVKQFQASMYSVWCFQSTEIASLQLGISKTEVKV